MSLEGLREGISHNKVGNVPRDFVTGQNSSAYLVMVAKALNTLGLMLNIFGVIILFFFSFPQPSHQAYVGIAVESGTVLSDGRTAADHANDARLTRDRYVFYSGCGMMLIIVGFVFQLIGTWSDEKSEWL